MVEMKENKLIRGSAMDNKQISRRVRVSKNRQFNIPKDFYDHLGMGEEAIIELHNNRLVIRNAESDNNYFAEQIMEELFSEGYSNDQEGFISEFKRRSNEIKPAVESLITDALANSEPLDVDNMFDDEEESK